MDERSRTRCYIGGIPCDIAQEEVHHLFSACGALRSFTLILDQHMPHGFGFVEFENPEAAEAAIRLDGTMLKGHRLRVEYTLAARMPPQGNVEGT